MEDLVEVDGILADISREQEEDETLKPARRRVEMSDSPYYHEKGRLFHRSCDALGSNWWCPKS
jgi:hypothetical protein